MKVASPVGRSKIEDYAFLSDTQSGALVSRDGCVDWLCLPRFDSGACFAALLGGPENGTWRLTPQEKIKNRERRYRGDTLILETDTHRVMLIWRGSIALREGPHDVRGLTIRAARVAT